MRRRHDGNRLLGDVDAVLQAGFVNVGKPVNDEFRGLVRDVEQHMIRAAAFHFAVNGAGHDVARRKRFERMVFVHELDAADGLEHAAFAAHRLADEK